MTRQSESGNDGDAASRAGEGIAFNEVQISFTYSFYCLPRAFDDLVNQVRKAPPSAQHVFTTGESEPDNGKFYWRTVTHPERRGLTPTFDYVHRMTGGPDNGACEEICCTYKEEGGIEVASGLSEKKDFGEKPAIKDLRLSIHRFELMVRFNRSGMGTVTFTFWITCNLESTERQPKTIRDHFPAAWRERQAKMCEAIGVLPFIFAITTLARAEHEVLRSDDVPLSKLRHTGKGAELLGWDRFITLHKLFDTVLAVFLKRARELLEADGKPDLVPVDQLLLDHAKPVERESPYWQSPYVTVYATVDPDKTFLKNPTKGTAPAWWFEEYCDGLFARDNYSTKASTQLSVWRCYKEAVLLLLRLYQWRRILAVTKFLTRYADSRETPIGDFEESHWRRVLVLPALMRESHYGYLFADVDLVWDTRFLMLYHERSTLVLNTVIMPELVRGSFREMFRQSLMRTLEGIRGQLHAGIVLNLYLDLIIDQVADKPEATRDVELLTQIQELRAAYSKVLRDPNAMATDAGALNVVRRRAHHFYGMDEHYQLLRSKFDALSQLIGGQAMTANLATMQAVLKRRAKE